MAARRRSRPRQPPGPGRIHAQPQPDWLFPAAAALLILAAGGWAYSTSFGGVFLLDDVRAIVRNETIRTLWPLSVTLAPPPASTVAGRPVANLSFAINYALSPAPASAGEAVARPPLPRGAPPLDPAPFHAGNLVIHLAAALALFGVVRRTLASRPLAVRFGDSASWLAPAVALVWVVHPLTTSAVTYIVQRAESLMGLFYLLTLYCSIRALGEAGSRWWAPAAVSSCAAGMATKEVMVTAPVMVAVWWWLFAPARTARPGPGGGGHALRLFAGLSATWLVLAFLVAGERRGPSVDLAWGTAWSYLLAQAGVVVHYLRLAFARAPLVFLYDWPLAPSFAAVAWQAVFLTTLTVLTAVGIAMRRPASFLGAWFLLILAPSSSVLPIVTEVAAEHRMYLPLAAVVAAVVVGLYLAGRRALPSRNAGVAASLVAMIVAVGVLGAETRDRNRVYWSAERLWQDTVAKRPNDARARVALGEALAVAGRAAEAEAQLWAAVSLAPGDGVARVRLGSVLAQQGKFDAAVPQLEQALALRPGDVDAHRFLGEIYAIQRRDALAVRHYEQAIAAAPGDAQVIAHLAAILADSRELPVRNPARARALAERAVQLTGSRDPRMLEILSVAQAATGALSQAAATARTGAAAARAVGDSALASSLEYRASTYEQAAR